MDEGWQSHYDRFQHCGELDDIEKAIEYITRALELDSAPEDDPNKVTRHSNLGAFFHDRYLLQGSLSDLECAIEHGSRAVALTPHGHPELAARLGNLAGAFRTRFLRLGDMVDLNRMIEQYSRAVELTPDAHPESSERYANLGVAYNDRFQRLGDIHDLDRAIKHKSRAHELTPDGHPRSSDRHALLGIAYSDRFQRLDEIDDLDRAIEHESRALELTPDSHPELGLHLGNLGNSYRARFLRLGGLYDLEIAIEYYSSALELTFDGHRYLPDRHATLGVAYNDRFRHLGDLDDLERAIKHISRAIELTPDGHPKLSGWYFNLGISYNDRFGRLGDMHDLDFAIKHKSRAYDLTPEGHPDLSERHSHLGTSYTDRFRQLGEIHDIEKAIEHHSRALELTPDDHPRASDPHADLGLAYAERFYRTGEVHDRENIIEHFSRSLALTPEGHPALPDRHFGRGYAFLLQYQHTNDQTHLESSLNSYRKACQLSSGDPRPAFQKALAWAKNAGRYSSLNCLEAYQTAMDLLPRFIWLGATTTQRYQDLTTIENLAINAAHAAILHSDLSLSLEWLEHARCVVWNQTLMLRTPLDQLESSHPDLAVRLQAVSNQLYEAGSRHSTPQPLTADPVNFEQIGRNRRRLAGEYTDLLAETRKLPGFESFLRPLKANELVCAARYGPIVVINCHEDRSDALIILPGEYNIKHLPLPNFSAKEARSAHSDLETSLRSKGLRQRGVKVFEPLRQKDRTESMLLDLWTHIVKPILDFLEFIKDDPPSKIPHITWCPTSALSFLPLHAAGDYSQPRSRAFDHVVSSYTPTLTSLLVSTSTTQNPRPRLLAIGQANTPGCVPLPGTTRELAYLKAHAKNNAEYSELAGDQATIAGVLDGMANHDWVHLACHAHQNVEDPTKSGFYLHDGALDLASINRQSFKNKGLAFLSACQTATGDEKLPDEAVHLASGILMAGYKSVIATMWSVGDTDAPLVAEKVYAQLMKDGKLGNGEAGRALHYAVEELRETVGENTFWRWVPYIHIGS